MASPLPTMDLADNPTGCCPRFSPDSWDNQDFDLEGLVFIKASTTSFLYMPLNMDAVMRRTQQSIEAASARAADRSLVLSRDVSLWRADHYFLVTKPVPGYQPVALPGVFHAKVFEGAFSQMGTWYKAMEKEMATLGSPMDEVYAFYTTCPKCAKAYGKNYVVLMARVRQAA